MRVAYSCSYSDLAIQPIDNAVINAQKTIFQEIYYFERWRGDCIKIWTEDADIVHLSIELLNSFDETLEITGEISSKSLSFLDLKNTCYISL